jgi:peptidoglycan/LPS O-acetylase OafA/YrhL
MSLQRSVGADGERALGPTGVRLQEDALDGMRGVAALLVIASHLSHFRMQLIPGLDLEGIGKPGVYLFFVLSAFLLTRQILSRDAAALADRRLWLRYFTRRFLRIFPLLTLLLVSSDLNQRWFGLGLPFPLSGWEVVDHLLLRDGKGVLWSVPPEFQYYFVLPAIGVSFVLLRRQPLAAIGGCLVASALALRLWPPVLALESAPELGPYLPIFLCGSVAALVHSICAPTADRHRRMYEGVAIAALLAAAITTPSLFGVLSGQPVRSNHFHANLVFYGLVWSAFLVATLLGSGLCRRALSGRVIRYVGHISFSTYLWHPAVVRVVRNLSPLPALPSAWIALALVLLIASASYFWIERPFLRIRIGGAR